MILQIYDWVIPRPIYDSANVDLLDLLQGHPNLSEGIAVIFQSGYTDIPLQ